MVELVKPKVRPLSPERMVRADYANLEYRVTPVEGTEPNDLLQLDYWVHEARTLRAYDRITAIPDDLKWCAHYLVTEVGTGFAQLALLWKVDLEPASEALPAESPVEVQLKGPHLKHVVIRKSDRVVLKDKIAKRVEAEAWARDYATRITA